MPLVLAIVFHCGCVVEPRSTMVYVLPGTKDPAVTIVPGIVYAYPKLFTPVVNCAIEYSTLGTYSIPVNVLITTISSANNTGAASVNSSCTPSPVKVVIYVSLDAARA